MIDALIKAVFRPFILKALPDIFKDLDEWECDFAGINLSTGQVDIGTINPFKVIHSKQFDVLEGIENQKVLGQTLERKQATDMISGLSIERFATETTVTCFTKLEDFGEIKVTYTNTEIWKETLRQGKPLK